MQLSISQPKKAINKPKLLVVDDEPDNLDLLYRTFYREFNVLRAENGYEALNLLATQPDVAVIVSDQRMPGMSGTEFLSQTAAKYPNIIRIILTGYTDVDDLVDAINEGKVFKYVQKPWEDEHLRQVVKRALETHVVLKTRTEELQRVLRQESLLNAITNTIRSTHSSQQMMRTIVETVGALMEASLCVLRPTTGGTLGTQTFVYRSPAMAEHNDLSAHLNQLAWSVSEVTVLDGEVDRLTDQQQQLWQRLGIQSSILVPLVVSQEPIAVLALHQCGQLRPWEGSEMQLLVTVSDQAALALGQASTYEQVQALARREQLINRLTQAIRSSLEPEAIFAAITQELGQALQVDGCALSLWTANAEYVECVGLYEPSQAGIPPISGEETTVGNALPRSQVPIHTNPVLQQVLETQQPVALDDLSQLPEMAVQDSLRSPARSLLVVPLIADGKILGSISLRQTQHPRIWQAEEIELAQAVAAQAAIAVQQSRLYQTMRDQAAQLMILDRQKTEFFQNISHEFRTPLTLTLGPLETAVSRGEGLSLEHSAVALRNARRLLRLTLLAPAVVDNLLANPDVAINLESVLRRVMPLDWQAQGAVFAGA